MKTGVTIAPTLIPAQGLDIRDLAQKYLEPPIKKVQLSPLCNNGRAQRAHLVAIASILPTVPPPIFAVCPALASRVNGSFELGAS
jgi:hypothetical protein